MSKRGDVLSTLCTMAGGARPNQAQLQDARRRMNQQPAIHGAQITADAALAQPPIGAVLPYAGAGDPPDGKWIVCDGRILGVEDYPDLYATLGARWNDGAEAAGAFRIPDCRGRASVGAGQGQGLASRPPAQKFGAERETLAIAHLPAHSHGGGTEGTSHDHGGNTRATTHSHGADTSSADTTHRHSTIVPGWGGTDDPSSQGWPSGGIHRGLRSTDRPGEFGMDQQPVQPTSQSHRHNVSIDSNTHAHPIPDEIHSHPIRTQGDGAAHNNLPPSLAFDFIIRALV